MLNLSQKLPSSDAMLAPLPIERIGNADPPTTGAPLSLEVDPQPTASPAKRLRLSTPVCFSLAFILIALTITLGNFGASPIVGVLGISGAVLFGFSTLIAGWRALHGMLLLVRTLQGKTSLETGPTIARTLGNLLMTSFGALVAYFASVGFARGRQLRRLGRVVLPSLGASPTWTTAPVALSGPQEPPTGVADQWRENGKTEHASVGAFAKLTLDLMALGAPPALIATANQDGLDEIRHAELCFSLAYAIDGRSVSPRPFPEAQRVGTLPRSRTLALAKLAVDSLIDGALHEGVSARIIAKLAQRCDVPAIRAALKEIAADEGRHAAHGWAVVEWCSAEGGHPVVLALLGASRALPKEMRSQLPELAADGGWEQWGIHGNRLEAQEYLAARSHVIQRVRTLVAGHIGKAA